MRLIDGEITVEQVRTLIDACYEEFCQVVGDGVCGCDVCPYRESDADTGEDCYEAYIKDKLNEQSRTECGTENAVEFEPVRHGYWASREIITFGGRDTSPLFCSECLKVTCGESWTYCPNCGAKMDGESNE